jgi:hypothetical protein
MTVTYLHYQKEGYDTVSKPLAEWLMPGGLFMGLLVLSQVVSLFMATWGEGYGPYGQLMSLLFFALMLTTLFCNNISSRVKKIVQNTSVSATQLINESKVLAPLYYSIAGGLMATEALNVFLLYREFTQVEASVSTLSANVFISIALVACFVQIIEKIKQVKSFTPENIRIS